MKIDLQEYCKNLSSYQRLPTREVRVGDVSIGKDNPIRVQSMTTTDTMDTKGTVDPVSYTHLTLPTILLV